MLKQRDGAMRWRAATLLAVGAVIGTIMVATPAGAHVGGTVNHLWNHIKPKADARYARKTLPSGTLLTGNYAAWGTGAGYMGANVHFRTPLAAEIPGANAHFLFVGDAFTTECPGYGDALADHLCVYERAQGNRSSAEIWRSEGAIAAGAGRNGFWIYYNIGAGGAWSYGEWALRGPSAATSLARQRAGDSPAPPGN